MARASARAYGAALTRRSGFCAAASFKTPGPGDYYPEKYVEKAAAFSLLQRLPTHRAFETPSPNAYTLPSCLNGTIEHL